MFRFFFATIVRPVMGVRKRQENTKRRCNFSEEGQQNGQIWPTFLEIFNTLKYKNI